MFKAIPVNYVKIILCGNSALVDKVVLVIIAIFFLNYPESAEPSGSRLHRKWDSMLYPAEGKAAEERQMSL